MEIGFNRGAASSSVSTLHDSGDYDLLYHVVCVTYMKNADVRFMHDATWPLNTCILH